MRTSLLVVILLFPLGVFADEARLSIGMSRDEVVATIKKYGGTDITPDLAVVGPKGEHPPSGYYWEFRDYDVIVDLSTKDGKVVAMSFWTKKDFDKNKEHRAQTSQSVTALTVNTRTKKVSVETRK